MPKILFGADDRDFVVYGCYLAQHINYAAVLLVAKTYRLADAVLVADVVAVDVVRYVELLKHALGFECFGVQLAPHANLEALEGDFVLGKDAHNCKACTLRGGT